MTDRPPVAAGPPSADDPTAAHRQVLARRPVLAVLLGVAVVAAGLVWLLWPTPAGPVVLTAGSDRHSVRLTVDQPRVGAAGAWLVEISDPAGQPVSAPAVRVDPVMPRMGHAIAPLTATAQGPGRYRVDAAALPMAGEWEITVAISGADGPDQVVFPLLVSG
ncbi:FixH family protein [Goodfellowiella coeruleoviolacea]|uniref:YtkA-like n=1 Tax=Goodfellowiella coeruleoviolacea TaxID=334858 RepID=A0AAE3GBH8_9PSEU|nr:FixH family protein [Goodfellowiella coeruleoviolacea]MCP2165251.1 YtkA-like [Goodfellowiella coeruleoviolacea]